MAEVEEAVVEVIEDVTEQVEDAYFKGVARGGGEVGLVIGAAAGLVIGLGAGYAIAKKRLEAALEMKYMALAEAEIVSMKEHFVTALKKQMEQPVELPTRPVPTKPELGEMVAELGYLPNVAERDKVVPNVVEDDELVEAEPEVTNIFEQSRPTTDWDWAEETKARTADIPYIIHKTEFETNEEGHEQVSLTYFEEDDVLMDGTQHIIEDQDKIVGLQNLGKFGHGSDDKSVVFVRNEYLEVEYEIVKSNGSYSSEVLGLEHADTPRRRGRRRYDDGT